MDIMSIIDNLEDIIDKGFGVPFIGKCLLDKQELLDIMADLRLHLPDDLKQAKWVAGERQRIIFEAEKEADNIIKNAENHNISLINDHEITRKAQAKANEIISRAQKRAREINAGAMLHADELLADAEKVLENTLATLREDRNSMRVKDRKEVKEVKKEKPQQEENPGEPKK